MSLGITSYDEYSTSGAEKSLRRTTTYTALATILVAILGLVGYLPGLRVLASGQAGLIPMAPATAIGFLLLGSILLWLISNSIKTRPTSIILSGFAFLTAVFGLVVLVGHYTGLNLSPEETVLPVRERVRGAPVGRMSPVTATFFVLAGVAVALLALRPRYLKTRAGNIAGSLGGLALLGSFTALLAYALGTPLLFARGMTTAPIALTTSFAFFLLSIAIITAAGRASFPLALFTGRATRARLMRAFLPIVVASVVIESITAVYLPGIVPVNRVFIVVVTVVSSIIITGVLVAWISVGIGRAIDEASEALRFSEERFSKAFQHDPDAIAISSLDTMKLVDVNEGFVRLTGFSRDDAVGKSTDELGIWADEEARAAMLETIQSKRRLDDLETIANSRTGERHVVLLSAEVIDMSGRPHVISVARDITGRKQAEDAVRQKDREIRKAYADVFSAVTEDKLLILTSEEIPAALGKLVAGPRFVRSYEEMADSRRFLRDTLGGLKMSQQSLRDLIAASGEAVLNGIKHAGACEVSVYDRDGTVQIKVTDRGPGIDFGELPKATLVRGYSTKKSLGMGFAIILDMCNQVLLSTGREGTTVILESGGSARSAGV